MKTLLFDSASQQILLSPGVWRMVGSLFEPEVAPVTPSRRHLAWMRRHVDRHPVRELLVALRGRGRYGFRGQVYPCQPGSVFLFDASEPHDNRYFPGGGAMRHLWLFLFRNDVIAQVRDIDGGRIVATATPSLLRAGTASAGLLASTWDRLAAAGELPPEVKRACLVAALAAVLAELVAAEYDDPALPGSRDLGASVIQAIQRHVAEHAGRGIPLGEAARLAGYSKFHFARLFRTHTGQTYHAYVNACRLGRARELLAEGRRKKEIAEDLGFSHASACLRWLKQVQVRSGGGI